MDSALKPLDHPMRCPICGDERQFKKVKPYFLSDDYAAPSPPTPLPRRGEGSRKLSADQRPKNPRTARLMGETVVP
jgi:hypothetical protein